MDRRNRIMKLGKLLISLVIVSLLLSMAIPMAAAKPGGGGGKPPKDPPDPTPANPAIAYTTDGQRSLWVMDADGSHQTSIYGTDENIGKPTWAPDGSAIAFEVGILNGELWRIDVDVVDGVPLGSNPMLLHSSAYYNAEWSPAGDVILFPEKTYSPDLYHLRTIPATGGEATTLYTSPAGTSVSYPTWSPDAATIAFMELTYPPYSYEIKTFDVATSAVTTIYGPVTTHIHWLEWGKSTDSTEIVFTMRIPDGGFGIYTIDIASQSPTAVLIEGGDSRFPSWSPDDSQIAYTSKTPRPKGPKTDFKIWVEDVDTGTRTELVKGWALDWKR
jgi:Tol biopolymer transport system component